MKQNGVDFIALRYILDVNVLFVADFAKSKLTVGRKDKFSSNVIRSIKQLLR